MPETTREQRRQRRRQGHHDERREHGAAQPMSGGGAHTVERIVFTDAEVDGIVGRQTSDSGARNIRFALAVDKEADFLDLDYFVGTRVGHAWIIITYPDGTEDSYGFWPDLRRGGGIDWNNFWEDGPGQVRHPDLGHRQTITAMHTVLIDHEQLARAKAYAASKASTPYNALAFQCTSFAREMFEHVTGQTAPSAGLLIDDPSDLAETIIEANTEHGLDPLEQPLAPRKQRKK